MTRGHGDACHADWVGRKLALAATRRSLVTSRPRSPLKASSYKAYLVAANRRPNTSSAKSL